MQFYVVFNGQCKYTCFVSSPWQTKSTFFFHLRDLFFFNVVNKFISSTYAFVIYGNQERLKLPFYFNDGVFCHTNQRPWHMKYLFDLPLLSVEFSLLHQLARCASGMGLLFAASDLLWGVCHLPQAASSHRLLSQGQKQSGRLLKSFLSPDGRGGKFLQCFRLFMEGNSFSDWWVQEG